MSARYCPEGNINQNCSIIFTQGDTSCFQISHFFFRTALNNREIEIFIENVTLSTTLTTIKCVEEDLRSGDIPIAIDTTAVVIYVQLSDTGNYVC